MYAGRENAGVDPGPTYVGRDINMLVGTYIFRPEEAERLPGEEYAGPEMSM
jgi:hypothetical protein